MIKLGLISNNSSITLQPNISDDNKPTPQSSGFDMPLKHNFLTRRKVMDLLHRKKLTWLRRNGNI